MKITRRKLNPTTATHTPSHTQQSQQHHQQQQHHHNTTSPSGVSSVFSQQQGNIVSISKDKTVVATETSTAGKCPF